MRYERLIVESGPDVATVRFHPRLTVIAGVGPRERHLLVTELLGSLSGQRPGAHLELADDGGRRLALVRPERTRAGPDGLDRVLEIDSGEDLSHEFSRGGGGPDLLAGMGLTVDQADVLCRLTGPDLLGGSDDSGGASVSGPADSSILTLAAVDQTDLWIGAERVTAAAQELSQHQRTGIVAEEDTSLTEEIERRHAAVERSEREHGVLRLHGVPIAGGLGAAGAVTFVVADSPPVAAVLAVLALLALAASGILRSRLARAVHAEAETLARAGKPSYMTLHLQRVDRLLDGQTKAARLSAAADEHALAEAGWRAMAGDISVEWALHNRAAIEAASQAASCGDSADRSGRVVDVRSGVRPGVGAGVGAGVGSRDGGGVGRATHDPADLAHALAARFTALRRVGPSAVSLPLILDDPLTELDPGTKQWILELIGRSAGAPQVIFLTADPEVAAWAQMEVMTGNLSVVGPAAPVARATRQPPVRITSRTA